MQLRAAFYLVLSTCWLCHATVARADESGTPTDYSLVQDTAPPTKLALTETQLSLRPADQIDIPLPGGTEPTASFEPAPGIDLPEATEPTADGTSTPVDATANTDLWDRIRVGFALADMDSPLIKEHESWYANRPEYVRRMVERSQRYLFHIVEEVEKRGMPTEIALLPMIESAYNPKAYSTSHASGIWQFVPATGRNFGLNQNWLYDGRRDIMAATDAALDYLQKLYNMFGDWELALAAYNWGEGSVARAIAKNQARGEPTDYLSLHLPPETRNYVPKLLAVKNIVTNPAAYGLEINSIPNTPYFASVKIKQQMDVAVAARLAEVPLEEFVALNPAYNKPLVAGVGKPTLLLPVDKVNNFSLNLENYGSPLSSWQTYTPHRGEKLHAIAQRFGISLARLKEINGIAASGRKHSHVSQTLLVPIVRSGQTPSLASRVPDTIPVAETHVAERKTTHVVVRGDTVQKIAKRYGMTVAELKSQNHIKGSALKRGQKLTVLVAETERTEQTRVAKREASSTRETSKRADAKPAKGRTSVAKESSAKRHYVVKRGDTMFSIARRFKVAVNDLQRWNNLPANSSLHAGHKLAVSSPRS